MFLRVVLILIVLYLVLRALKAFLRPPRPRSTVEGDPPRAPRKIDTGRVQDATFKDLPEE